MVYTPPARYTHATRTLHARYTLVVQVATKGLSFKHVELDGSQSFILLDSEGSYSPVKVTDELSVVEKEATELFLQAGRS